MRNLANYEMDSGYKLIPELDTELGELLGELDDEGFDLDELDEERLLDWPASLSPNVLDSEVSRRSSTYIRWLQKQLNRIGSAGLSVDGAMGSRTRDAIRTFQKKYSVVYPPNGKPSEVLDAFLIMFGAPPPPGAPKLGRFSPSELPPDVYAAYIKGAGSWKMVLQRALDSGITDAGRLADIMFFLAHPERKGRQINSGEANAIREWNDWRDKIRPILDARRAGRARVYPAEVPKEMIAWLESPAHGMETHRFRSANPKKYRFLVAWKSDKKKLGCGSGNSPADRSWFAAARDDLAYWRRFTKTERVAKIVADAKRTYNEKIAWYMQQKKLCAKAARRTLRDDDKKWLLQLATVGYGVIPVPGAGGTGALKSLVDAVGKTTQLIQWLKEHS